jgi:hypothetical protein
MDKGLVVGDVLWVMMGVSGEAEREVLGALDSVLGVDMAGARVTGQVITVDVGLMTGAARCWIDDESCGIRHGHGHGHVCRKASRCLEESVVQQGNRIDLL